MLTILLSENNQLLLNKIFEPKFNYYLKFLFPEVTESCLTESVLSETKQNLSALDIVKTASGKDANVVICTHSLIIFNTIRLEVYRKNIDFNQVEVLWLENNKETNLIIDSNGRMNLRPRGCFDTNEHILHEMLKKPTP